MKTFTDANNQERVKFEDANDIANSTIFFRNIFVLGITEPVFYAMTLEGKLVLGDHNAHLEGVVVDKERILEYIKAQIDGLVDVMQEYANVRAKVDFFSDLPFSGDDLQEDTTEETSQELTKTTGC